MKEHESSPEADNEGGIELKIALRDLFHGHKDRFNGAYEPAFLL